MQHIMSEETKNALGVVEKMQSETETEPYLHHPKSFKKGKHMESQSSVSSK